MMPQLRQLVIAAEDPKRSNEEMQAREEKAGVRRGTARPARIPFAEYRTHDPEGNGIDISQKGWKV